MIPVHQGKCTWHRSHVLVYIISPVQFPTFWGLCHVFLPSPARYRRWPCPRPRVSSKAQTPTSEFYVKFCVIGVHLLIYLEPQTTIYKWLFQLDDSQSLHRKCLVKQTSIFFMVVWGSRYLYILICLFIFIFIIVCMFIFISRFMVYIYVNVIKRNMKFSQKM